MCPLTPQWSQCLSVFLAESNFLLGDLEISGLGEVVLAKRALTSVLEAE